ncbi:MAG: DUF1059 domain-containing protein [Candidatus Thermoplasmatota archaeon]|jgi:predicted small metal-binding protein|nr:DUF1059 domain-containing protein [Candidatus Thermoplasmatota archaeon]
MATFLYKCRDIGYDCGFEFSAHAREDLMPRIRIHSRYAHNIYEMSEETTKKIEAAIKQID